MNSPGEIRQKIEELEAEMKKAGLWRGEKPAWVKQYRGESSKLPEPDFFEWLQFVYLPNRLMTKGSSDTDENYITVQVKKYAADTLLDQRIVRLLIELDAL